MKDLNLRAKERFSKASKTYDKFADSHKRIIDYLLSKSKTPCLSGEILELGSGTGLLTEKLSQIAYSSNIISLDYSHEMLSIQKKKKYFKSANPEILQKHLIQGDINSLPFINNSFDHIFSSTALQWSKLDYITDLVSKNLKNNGSFSLAIITSGTFDLLREVKEEVTGEKSDNFLPQYKDIKAAFEDTQKLQLENSEKHIFISTYKTASSALSAIRALGIGETNDKKLTEVELREFKKKYLEKSTKKYGSPYLNYEVSFFFGIKK